MKNTLSFIIIIYFSLVIVEQTQSQSMQSRFLQNSKTVAGLGFQRWSFEDIDGGFTQFSIPVNFIYPVNDQLSVDLITSPAINSFGDNGLSGLSDTYLRGSYIIPDKNMLATFGISLPTGKSKLNLEESGVSSIIALRALQFQVPNMGQGLDVNLGVVAAHEMNGIVIGGGIGYLLKGKFCPTDGSDSEYNPGNEFSITLGADYGEDYKLTGDLIITFYGKDQRDDQDIHKSGSKFLLQLKYIRQLVLTGFKPIDMLVYLRNRSKGKNEFYYGENTLEMSNGNQLEIGSIATYPYADNLSIKGLLDLKFYSNNDDDINGAFVFGIGGGITHKYSDQITFDGILKFSKGHLNKGSSEMGITGIELLGGINYKF